MSETMLTGIAIVGGCALVGIIGVMSDTRNNPGLKWALFFILLAGAGAGIHNEIKNDASTKIERQRARDAVKLAEESRHLVKTGLMKQQELELKCNEDRNRLEDAITSGKQLSETMMGHIVAVSSELVSLNDAARENKKAKPIAESAEQARLKASKALIGLARQEGWLEPKDLATLDKQLKKKKEPLSTEDLAMIHAKMKAHLAK